MNDPDSTIAGEGSFGIVIRAILVKRDFTNIINDEEDVVVKIMKRNNIMIIQIVF